MATGNLPPGLADFAYEIWFAGSEKPYLFVGSRELFEQFQNSLEERSRAPGLVVKTPDGKDMAIQFRHIARMTLCKNEKKPSASFRPSASGGISMP